MSASTRIGARAIVQALRHWEGNVAAAADELGMSRNGLYYRIQRLAINLGGLRDVGGKFLVMGPGPSAKYANNANNAKDDRETPSAKDASNDREPPSASNAQKSSSAKYPDADLVAIFGDMLATEGEELDLMGKARHHRLTVRLDLEDLEEIQRVRLAFQAIIGEETTNGAILKRYIRHGWPDKGGFSAWAEETLLNRGGSKAKRRRPKVEKKP